MITVKCPECGGIGGFLTIQWQETYEDEICLLCEGLGRITLWQWLKWRLG